MHTSLSLPAWSCHACTHALASSLSSSICCVLTLHVNWKIAKAACQNLLRGIQAYRVESPPLPKIPSSVAAHFADQYGHGRAHDSARLQEGFRPIRHDRDPSFGFPTMPSGSGLDRDPSYGFGPFASGEACACAAHAVSIMFCYCVCGLRGTGAEQVQTA